jgi:hypothetical protein
VRRTEPTFPVKTRNGWIARSPQDVDTLLEQFDYAMWCYAIGIYTRALQKLDAIADALKDCGVLVDVEPAPKEATPAR